MSTPAIEYVNTSYHVNGLSVVAGLELTVQQGETCVLLGRSGSGKTTALKLANRLLEASGGVVKIQGKSTLSWDPIRLRRHIGYVIQEIGLFPHLTVEGNVSLIPSLERWKPERTRDRVRELLRLVSLDPDQFTGRYPSELSGGQRQRVGVARALAIDPPILLMDEPFGALDPLTRRDLQQEFKELQERLNKTILFVTHDLDEALLLASRIGVMETGSLIFKGSAGELMKSPDPRVQAFCQVSGRPEA
ncbi:MAG: ATP-binding cassette domain-containing protein [Acidobacteriota bacterium]